jgi:hypothetical protein
MKSDYVYSYYIYTTKLFNNLSTAIYLDIGNEIEVLEKIAVLENYVNVLQLYDKGYYGLNLDSVYDIVDYLSSV